MSAVHDVASDHLLIVLSADEACFERVRRLRVDGYIAQVEWVADPTKLGPVLANEQHGVARRTVPVVVSDRGQLRGRAVGVVLDLTDSRGAYGGGDRRSLRFEVSREELLAWQIGAVLAIACEPNLPVLLVSDALQVESALRWYDALVVERIAHGETDVVWQRAIRKLVAGAQHARVPGTQTRLTRQTGHNSGMVATEPPAPICLTEDLRFDSVRGALLTEDGEIALTARESELLALLLHVPGVQYSADQLARKLSHSAPYPVSQQSVLQTVCSLRCKLGDSARPARILVHRRGYGYAVIADRDALPQPCACAYPALATVSARA